MGKKKDAQSKVEVTINQEVIKAKIKAAPNEQALKVDLLSSDLLPSETKVFPLFKGKNREVKLGFSNGSSRIISCYCQ